MPKVRVLNKKELLWKLTKDFIKENEITCSDSIYQCDRVIANSYDFLKKICDIVGYHEY